MSKTRRVATMVAAAVTAVGMATVVAANPAAAAPKGPHPVTNWIEAVKAHKASWVEVFWTTGKKICGAQLTVEGGDVWIGYPANTGTYTSFSEDDKLKPKEIDYTAFQVRADYDRNEFVPLEATLVYQTCGAHPVKKSKTFWLILPVRKNRGH